MARNLAEIRGLMNQVIRRLERVESDLLAERHARVDDLALLVDLISSGWKASTSASAASRPSSARLEQSIQENRRRHRVPDGRPPPRRGQLLESQRG